MVLATKMLVFHLHFILLHDISFANDILVSISIFMSLKRYEKYILKALSASSSTDGMSTEQRQKQAKKRREERAKYLGETS